MSLPCFAWAKTISWQFDKNLSNQTQNLSKSYQVPFLHKQFTQKQNLARKTLSAPCLLNFCLASPQLFNTVDAIMNRYRESSCACRARRPLRLPLCRAYRARGIKLWPTRFYTLENAAAKHIAPHRKTQTYATPPHRAKCLPHFSHVVEKPPPNSKLIQIEGGLAHRFEDSSHIESFSLWQNPAKHQFRASSIDNRRHTENPSETQCTLYLSQLRI